MDAPDKTTGLTPKRLREILNYCPLTGAIHNRRTNRLLHADHDGLVTVFCSEVKKPYKLKLDRVAFALAYGFFPRKDKRVLHRNLNIHDNSLKNLAVVSRGVFLMIKEAHKNLQYGIKIQAHPVDQFCYVVHWVEQNKDKTKVVHDILEARRVSTSLQLHFSKILTKYCMFD
jgi:hypothetical protein